MNKYEDFSNPDITLLNRFTAICDMLHIFAETEIGSNVEIDIPAVYQYLTSVKGSCRDFWDAETKEKSYEIFTNQILDGYPVWQLLKIPEWTKNMLEHEFSERCEREKEKIRQKYICLRCRYLRKNEVSMGTLYECLSKNAEKELSRGFGRWIKLKQRCKYYEPAKE